MCKCKPKVKSKETMKIVTDRKNLWVVQSRKVWVLLKMRGHYRIVPDIEVLLRCLGFP